ncbi:hypothetical protein V493_02373 [Pseudogymnoascus sp. VKM F-4281 (FW-2241)]|nr:hypothetical protein V493_02373 [Pseudogymnoascus sp. VKM F-4281 (FW-2241)]
MLLKKGAATPETPTVTKIEKKKKSGVVILWGNGLKFVLKAAAPLYSASSKPGQSTDVSQLDASILLQRAFPDPLKVNEADWEKLKRPSS